MHRIMYILSCPNIFLSGLTIYAVDDDVGMTLLPYGYDAGSSNFKLGEVFVLDRLNIHGRSGSWKNHMRGKYM
jgi:hypothetical protein